MAFGISIFGVLADKVGRRPALLTFQAGAFVMVLVYSQLTDANALLIGGAIMGMFVNGMLGGYGALLSELYPTEARATAENVLFNLGRGVGGFGPVVVGALVVSYSFTVAIALLATIYLLDIVATLFLIPEKKGQFVHYTLVRESLVNTLNGFVQEVCPVTRPLKKESQRRAKRT